MVRRFVRLQCHLKNKAMPAAMSSEGILMSNNKL